MPKRTLGIKKLAVPYDSAAISEKEFSSKAKLSSLKQTFENNTSSMEYEAVLNNISIIATLDPGASHAFISPKAAKICKLEYKPVHDVEIELGDNSKIIPIGVGLGTIIINGYEVEQDIFVINMDSEINNTPCVIIGRTWLDKDNPNVNWYDNSISLTRKDGKKFEIFPKKLKSLKTSITFKKTSLKKLARIVKKQDGELFAVKVRPKPYGSPVKNCSDNFIYIVEEFKDIFVEELPDQLPPKRDLDFEINLKSDEPPPVRPVIRLSTDELKELKKQLTSLLQKGFIRPSTSPYGAPVFFVKKKNGDLRMVCDYRALNKITIPDSTPLPLLNESLDQVSGATIFSQIDLIGAYHQMRIAEKDIPKTAIRTRFGSFEWTVLCFGFTNAPASFSRLIAGMLHSLNGECLVQFLDDILVYSKSIDEHKNHLRNLFSILKKNRIYVRSSKCNIGVDEVEFLGFNVSAMGIHTQKRLVDAVQDWPVPKNIHEVRQFIGLANFYRRFIHKFAAIVQPITDLLKGKNFEWGENQEESFKRIKEELTSAPVLVHPSSEKEFVVSTDASKYAVGATLEQEGHPVAFLSHRLSDTETGWDTGDQELYGFMLALREWDVYLRGRQFKFKTDHEPIRYLQSKIKLTGRQHRWLDELQQYTYEIEHIPGKLHIVPDALSRRPDLKPQLKQMEIHNSEIISCIKKSYEEDDWSKSAMEFLANREGKRDQQSKMEFSNFKCEQDLLYWTGADQKRVYVPNAADLRTSTIKKFHGIGHLGIDKTYANCSKHLYWKNMYKDITNYISMCRDCQRNKSSYQKTAGLLQPLKIPEVCWEVVTTDFLTELPETDSGFEAIIVIVDKLSKRAIFEPINKSATAQDVAQVFQDRLFSAHGMPRKIISDRDPRYTSNFWKSLVQLLNIECNLSTANHPETDGQSENIIRTLSNMLKSSIQKSPKDWDKVLSIVEFEYNSAKHKSTGLSPFEVDIGRIPYISNEARNLVECTVQCQSSFNFIEKQESYRKLARDSLAAAQSKQKYYADQHRKHVEYKVGEWVMLRVDNNNLKSNSTLPQKWQPKYLGPVEILQKLGPVTYKVELPPSMKRAHNVFHVSKFKPATKPSDSENVSVTIDKSGKIEEAVYAILDKKRRNRKLYFLVQFVGDNEEEAIWMQKSELGNCKELLQLYNKNNRITKISEL